MIKNYNKDIYLFTSSPRNVGFDKEKIKVTFFS